jgi:hypothetical protein
MHTPAHTLDRAGHSLAPIGYGVGAISLLAVVALAHHPVGGGNTQGEVLASIRAQAGIDKIVHATLALVYVFLGSAMALFAARLGLRRFTVVTGLVAFSGALVLTVLATMTDGFVIPALAQHCATAPSASCTAEAFTLLRLSAIQIEFLSRFSLIGVALAVASWSAALLTTRTLPMWPGLAAAASAACQAAALIAASGPLSPRTLLAIYAGQIVWYLVAATLMIRQRGPFGPQSADGA